jgi:hypothetical protein
MYFNAIIREKQYLLENGKKILKMSKIPQGISFGEFKHVILKVIITGRSVFDVVYKNNAPLEEQIAKA